MSYFNLIYNTPGDEIDEINASSTITQRLKINKNLGISTELKFKGKEFYSGNVQLRYVFHNNKSYRNNTRKHQ